MRSLVFLFTFLPLACFSQGTVIFSNDSTVLSSPPDRLIRVGFGIPWPFGTNNGPLVGTNFMVQLYYGASTASEASLIAVSEAPAHMTASTSSSPGVWVGGGTRTLTGFPFGSGTAVLQVRLWDINFGATYEQAFANAQGLVGRSVPFLYTIPQSTDPSSAFAMVGFTAFTITLIPEPAPLALAGLSAVALVVFRRRRSS